MGRSITAMTGSIKPVDGTNPYGSIKNVPAGTLVDEAMLADAVVFFQRLAAMAGITLNDLPDNAINTFQFFEAFLAVVGKGNTGTAGAWLPGGTLTITTTGGGSFTAGSGSVAYNKYITRDKTFHWQVQINTYTVAGTVNLIKIETPAAFFSSGGTWGNIGGTLLQHFDNGGTSNTPLNCELANDGSGNPIIILTHPTGTFPVSLNTNINIMISAERT